LLLVILGKYYAKPLLAQVRAVLTSSIDDPGRIAYQSTAVNTTCGGTSNCVLQFASPPAGHRVVVQRMSGFFAATSHPAYFSVALGTSDSPFLAQFLTPVSANLDLSSFNEPVQAYFDSGKSIQVVVGTDVQFSRQNIVTLSGYEVDCGAAPCSAIAH
jgi:hypothetical protein